jgi:DNA-binding CsgD family transcriptional regulator/pimeloyl-ACP methyl ester carboxylesterase
MTVAAVIPSRSGEAVIGDFFSGLQEGRADLVEKSSFSVAIVDGVGSARWTEAAFADLIADTAGSTDCRRLTRAAQREGRASGLVATSRGPIVVEARVSSAAGEWPLPDKARRALTEAADRILLIAFAPSRAPGFALVSAGSLGLAPREADLAAALLEAPNLRVAAQRVGMSAETAKDALARACRKAGVRGASELVGRLLDLSCGAEADEPHAVAATLGLTPGEARVAIAVGRGETVEATATSLGLSASTVKSYRKAIFAKTGASRDRDLRRLVAEASALGRLADASEIVLDDRAAGERLKVTSRPDGRRVAFIDYGPASGSPVAVMHGFTTGRRLPLAFVKRLQADGRRPVVIQRPGFGLTDPAAEDYLATGADDMAAVLAALNAESLLIVARDGGVATALAFAERHPAAGARGVLINPKSTRDRPPDGATFVATIGRLMLSQPAVIGIIGEAARQRSGSQGARALLNRLGGGVESDRLAAQNPEVANHLLRDVQGLLARSARGLIDELKVYADGWTPPPRLPTGPWHVAIGGALWSAEEAEAWQATGAETCLIDDLGLLPIYTHADALADLLAD